MQALTNSGGTALLADRLDVQGRFFCGHGFTAQGSTCLAGASIGAGMQLNGSRLSSSAGPALLAWGLTVGGIVNCCDGFTADGLVSFISARIGSELCFEAATINADLELSELARRGAADRLRYRHCRTSTAARFRRGASVIYPAGAGPMPPAWTASPTPQSSPRYRPPAGSAGLLATPTATTRSLMSNSRRHIARWGTTLTPAPSCSPSTAPGVAHCPRHCRHGDISRTGMVGYGYRPQRAALWLSALLIVGTIAFAARHPPPLAPGRAPEFNPVLYAIDLLLPHRSFRSQGRVESTRLAILAGGRPDRRDILATTIAAGIHACFPGNEVRPLVNRGSDIHPGHARTGCIFLKGASFRVFRSCSEVEVLDGGGVVAA